ENRHALRNHGHERQGIEVGRVVRGKDAGARRNVFKSLNTHAHSGKAARKARELHRQPVHEFRAAGDESPQNEPGQAEENGERNDESGESSANHRLVMAARQRAFYSAVPRSRPSRMRRWRSVGFAISAMEYRGAARVPELAEPTPSFVLSSKPAMERKSL